MDVDCQPRIPRQSNHPFDVLKGKFYCGGGRRMAGRGYENVGLVIYPPHKAKSPGESTEA